MELSECLAIWAAAVSTILGAIKIWEVWKQRLHITTSYGFAGPEDGNEVIIENPTNTPVMISYWLLFLVRESLWRKTIVNGRDPNEGYCNLTIPPHSRHVLTFRGKEWFRWPGGDGLSLALQLHIVGRRRPVWLMVFSARRPWAEKWRFWRKF